MKRLFQQFLMVVFALLVGMNVKAEYRGQGGKDDGDPLDNLTKRQKAHFDAYVALSERQKEPAFNRKEALEDTFGHVREWCKTAAPKYKMESMKAGDKAKTTENEKKKKALLLKSSTYAELYGECENIIKQFETGEIAFVEKALGKYKRVEATAKANAIPVMKREWLCYSEFTTLFMKSFAYKNRGKKQKDAVDDRKGQEGTKEGKGRQSRKDSGSWTEKKAKK